jgi:hypothetical protein
LSGADPTAEIAAELQRRGLAAPARVLLEAHRPFRPLLSDLATFLTPTLGPLLGRRVEALTDTLRDPARYDRLVERLDAPEG